MAVTRFICLYIIFPFILTMPVSQLLILIVKVNRSFKIPMAVTNLVRSH